MVEKCCAINIIEKTSTNRYLFVSYLSISGFEIASIGLKVTERESKFETIGTTQMEHEVVTKVIPLTKQELIQKKETGIHSSLTNKKIKQYLEDVFAEVRKVKSNLSRFVCSIRCNFWIITEYEKVTLSFSLVYYGSPEDVMIPFISTIIDTIKTRYSFECNCTVLIIVIP